MKMNLSLMKLTIRLLILMILFVILYLVSALLYSSRYWPDVYNYINANITIKHIPTLSELKLTVLEVDWTTEYYTTDTDYDTTTVEGFDFDIDDFTNIHGEFEPKRLKRNAQIEKFENDYIEVPSRSVVVDYVFLEDTPDVDEGVVWKKIVKDLIDESKLVPRNLGEIEMVNRKNGARLQKLPEPIVIRLFDHDPNERLNERQVIPIRYDLPNAVGAGLYSATGNPNNILKPLLYWTRSDF